MADCGLLNLGCLPQMFFEYVSSLLNAPIQPLLDLNKGLISTPVNITPFFSLWTIIIYVLSMFYAFLIIYCGIQFIASGYNPAKREEAKEWLKNIIIMIVLVQASFFIYELFVQLASATTSSTLTLVNANFFTLKTSSGSGLALEIIFFFMYITTLLLTLIMLILRYAIVSIGVVLFPLGIFFYFIQPLKAYGLLLLNFLGVCVFITFLDAILLTGFSMLITLPLFSNLKILVMITAFMSIDFMMFFLMFFSIIKSAFNVGTKVATIAAKFA